MIQTTQIALIQLKQHLFHQHLLLLHIATFLIRICLQSYFSSQHTSICSSITTTYTSVTVYTFVSVCVKYTYAELDALSMVDCSQA